MNHTLHVVRYSGPFGFIKPWAAVRDEETASQLFLLPSTLNGIALRLFPHREQSPIIRHKLTSSGTSRQTETTHVKSWEFSKTKREIGRSTAILTRHVLVYPVLYLAFGTLRDARQAQLQPICLCRNEDLLFPDADIITMQSNLFDKLEGIEFIEGQAEDFEAICVGRNMNGDPVYGTLSVSATPTQTYLPVWTFTQPVL